MSKSRAVGALSVVRWARSGFVVRATVSTGLCLVVGVRWWRLCYVGEVARRCLECSDALQMSSVLSGVRSVSLSSLSRIAWLLIPPIILSRIKPSLRSLNSHVNSSFLSSVAFWSIFSPCSWFLVLNLCRSNVMFFEDCSSFETPFAVPGWLSTLSLEGGQTCDTLLWLFLRCVEENLNSYLLRTCPLSSVI